MKQLSIITILISLLSVNAFAKSNMSNSNAMLIEAKDITWQAQAGFPGSYTWIAEGNQQKAHHAMHKFDAGFEAPLHHHSADSYGTVVKGTIILTVDDKEYRLSPGSFFSFKNKQPHKTACATGSECIMSLDVRGKWDIVPEKKLVTNK